MTSQELESDVRALEATGLTFHAASVSCAPSPGSVRPHAEQSALEQALRVERWHPADVLERMKENLPGHIRRKEYRQAADCQDAIRRAEEEVAKWDRLLTLYEQERISPNDRITDAAPPSGIQNETDVTGRRSRASDG